MRQVRKPEVLIEYPSRGATYCRNEYGVYEYGVYPRHSALAGQRKRIFRDSFKTLAEARAAYPQAELAQGSQYAPPDLSHLPDDTDY